MTHKIAFFSTKSYDETAFNQVLANISNQEIQITYFPHTLDHDTATLCDNADTVCVFVNDTLDKTTLEVLASKGVKHIALRCAGFNNVDLEAATELGILVSRVPAYSPETVAEHTLALILTLNRNTHKAYNRVKEGNFELAGLMGFTLHGKTVGVVGSGKIGKATMRILLGFGCKIFCYDPYPDDEVVAMGVEYVSLDTLFSCSDIVSLHCPLTQESHHLINASSISEMKKGVMLINTSRGGLVDTQAVIDGLKSKQIGYLGLDVYEQESELFFKDLSDDIIQDDRFQRLQTFPNVLITGHQGFFTREALGEIATVTLNNILDFSKKTPKTANFVNLAQ